MYGFHILKAKIVRVSHSTSVWVPSIYQALCQALGMLQRAKVDFARPSWSLLSTGEGKYLSNSEINTARLGGLLDLVTELGSHENQYHL